MVTGGSVGGSEGGSEGGSVGGRVGGVGRCGLCGPLTGYWPLAKWLLPAARYWLQALRCLPQGPHLGVDIVRDHELARHQQHPLGRRVSGGGQPL
jgi:hypothetical protein